MRLETFYLDTKNTNLGLSRIQLIGVDKIETILLIGILLILIIEMYFYMI